MTAERQTIEKTKTKLNDGKPSALVVVFVAGKETLALNPEKPKMKNEQK